MTSALPMPRQRPHFFEDLAMSTTLLDGVVKKNRARLIPFMLALYVLAFLDRSNIGFA